MTPIAPTLSVALWPTRQEPVHAWTRRICLTTAGVVALVAAAKVQIPFWPVPLTLQTMVIMVISLGYGFRLGSTTMLGYLLLGAAGAPVFASGGGIAYMIGPTGGYLAGFLLATVVVGLLGDRGWGKTVLTTITAQLLGLSLVFACGVTWLAYLIGLDKALAGGLYPFLAGEGVKMMLATAALPLVWRLVDRKDNTD